MDYSLLLGIHDTTREDIREELEVKHFLGLTHFHRFCGVVGKIKINIFFLTHICIIVIEV